MQNSTCENQYLIPQTDLRICWTSSNPDDVQYCSNLAGSANSTILSACFLAYKSVTTSTQVDLEINDKDSVFNIFATSTIAMIMFVSLSWVLTLYSGLLLVFLSRPKFQILTGIVTIVVLTSLFINSTIELRRQFYQDIFDDEKLLQSISKHHHITALGICILCARICQIQTILRMYYSSIKRRMTIALGGSFAIAELVLNIYNDVKERKIIFISSSKSMSSMLTYFIISKIVSLVIPVLFLGNVLVYTFARNRFELAYKGRDYRTILAAFISILMSALPIAYQASAFFLPMGVILTSFPLRAILPLHSFLAVWEWYNHIELNQKHMEKFVTLGHRIDESLYPKWSILNTPDPRPS